MLLVERYVEAVRPRLPRKERNDIAAELHEALVSQIEAEEAERGRGLTEDEVAEMLKRYGAPEVVAARYGGRDHLIGPAVYPHYRAVVNVVLWILGALVSVALVATAFTAEDPVAAMARVLWTGVFVVIANLTIVTLIFARLDRLNGQREGAPRWDPRDLMDGSAEPRTTIPRSEGVVSLLMTVFWLLWWTDVLPLNRWLLWGRLPLGPAPIWDALTPLIVTLMVVSMVVSVVVILRPRWARFYQASEWLLEIGLGVVLYRALRAPTFIVVTDPAAAGASIAGLLNTLVTVALVAWGMLIVVSVGMSLHRSSAAARQRRRQRPAAA